MAAAAAPGGTPLEGASSSTEVGANPFDAKPDATGKTRYSARAKQVNEEKKVKKQKKAKEKVAAGPIAATADEKASEQAQAAPLGLNGDTGKKKKKKQAKDKNAPKERLQNQPPKPAAPKPDETPSKAPNRGTPQEGTLPPAPKTPDAVPPTPPQTTPPTTPQSQ
jgi:peptidyl-prolyl cis-trans isomerase SurA